MQATNNSSLQCEFLNFLLAPRPQLLLVLFLVQVLAVVPETSPRG